MQSMKNRSGKIVATRDSYIEQLVNDKNYVILNDGSIFNRKMNKYISIYIRDGYKLFKYKGVSIRHHRLIYRKFIGPLMEDMVVNHIDGNSTNNSVSNLELISQSENNKHAFKSGKLPVSSSKYSTEDIQQIRLLKLQGKTYSEIRKLYPMAKSTLSYIINNKTYNKKTTKYTP